MPVNTICHIPFTPASLSVALFKSLMIIVARALLLGAACRSLNWEGKSEKLAFWKKKKYCVSIEFCLYIWYKKFKENYQILTAESAICWFTYSLSCSILTLEIFFLRLPSELQKLLPPNKSSSSTAPSWGVIMIISSHHTPSSSKEDERRHRFRRVATTLISSRVLSRSSLRRQLNWPEKVLHF